MKKMSRRDVSVNFRVGRYLGGTDVEWITDVETNLITDWGINALAEYYFTDMTRYVLLGNSNNPNKRSATMSQSGTTVQGSGFTQDDATYNRLIIHHNGARARIVRYTSSSSVVVDTSLSVPVGIGTVCYTDDDQLIDPQFISNIYLVEEGAISNTKTVDPATGMVTITNTRVVVFEALQTAASFKEIGWAPNNKDGLNSKLFGKRVINLNFDADDIPYVQVSIVRKIDCSEKTGVSVPLYGYTGTGTFKLRYDRSNFDERFYSTIAEDGSTVRPTLATMLENLDTSDKLVTLTNLTGMSIDETTLLPDIQSTAPMTPTSIKQVVHGLPYDEKYSYVVTEDDEVYAYEIYSDPDELVREVAGGPVIADVSAYNQLYFGMALDTGGELWALTKDNGYLRYIESYDLAGGFKANSSLVDSYTDIATVAFGVAVFNRGEDTIKVVSGANTSNSYSIKHDIDTQNVIVDVATRSTSSSTNYIAVLSRDEQHTYLAMLQYISFNKTCDVRHKQLISIQRVTENCKIIPISSLSFYIDELKMLVTYQPGIGLQQTILHNPPDFTGKTLRPFASGLYVPEDAVIYRTDGIDIYPYEYIPLNGYYSEISWPFITNTGAKRYTFNHADVAPNVVMWKSYMFPICTKNNMYPNKIIKRLYPAVMPIGTNVAPKVEAGYADDNYVVMLLRDENNNIIIQLTPIADPTNVIRLNITPTSNAAYVKVFPFYSIKKITTDCYGFMSANAFIAIGKYQGQTVWNYDTYAFRTTDIETLTPGKHCGFAPIEPPNGTMVAVAVAGKVQVLTYSILAGTLTKLTETGWNQPTGYATDYPNRDMVTLYKDGTTKYLIVGSPNYVNSYRFTLYTGQVAVTGFDVGMSYTLCGLTLIDSKLYMLVSGFNNPTLASSVKIYNPTTFTKLAEYAIQEPVNDNGENLIASGIASGAAIWRADGNGVYEYVGNASNIYRKQYDSKLPASTGIFSGENCYIAVTNGGIIVVKPRNAGTGIVEYITNIDLSKVAVRTGKTTVDKLYIGSSTLPNPTNTELELTLNPPLDTDNTMITDLTCIVKWLQN